MQSNNEDQFDAVYSELKALSKQNLVSQEVLIYFLETNSRQWNQEFANGKIPNIPIGRVFLN